MENTDTLPAVPALDNQTDSIRSQQLSSVTIWCSGGALHHWITSYKLVDDSLVNESGQKIAGISLDMYQPIVHELGTPGTSNQLGSLRIWPRTVQAGLLSKKPGVLKEIQFSSTVTVQDIVDLVIGQKRQYYRFHAEGSGCLYWQLQLLHAFVSQGWINKAEVDSASEKIGSYAKNNPTKVPFPPREGNFYKPV